MQGRDLVALRNEALVAFAAQPEQPVVRGWRRPLRVVATAAILSAALVVWLDIVGVLKTTSTEEAPSVQSVATEAQTPPPDVDIARSFEIMAAADPTERTEEAAAVPPEPADLLPKFLSWAADKDMSVPMENAQPLKVPRAKETQAKASSQDREREQEARADRRWEERHARRSAAARKNVRRAPQAAPTASTTPAEAPRESDSWRGG